MKRALAAVAVLALLASCNTVADAKNARGSGSKRTFPAPFELVWKAVPKAVNDIGLGVVGIDEDEGYVLAESGASAFSWGEKVAVFVEALGPRDTRVEVVSKAAVATNITAKDHESPLLNAIADRIGRTRR